MVLVVGSVALDSVRTPFGTVTDALGGSATFFSVAASYFTDVGLVAVVGRDFPSEDIRMLEDRGVDVTGLEIAEGETFRWSGTYDFDLNNRETIETKLNVFEQFRPKLPVGYRNADYVFLANIDPELQLAVLEQVEDPKFVALDTMNFWIEGKREALLEVIGRVDAIVLNDGECRELALESNLIKAGRAVLGMGPRIAIVKKGEHGAMMFAGDDCFSAPAYPCDSVFDPTGAGDSFAGGFMGHLATSDDVSEPNVRRAVIYGTVMASFCVEAFSIKGMSSLNVGAIKRRFKDLKDVSHFDM
jgi:sugar/nucleoside kinase (ribokinase family)